VQEHLNIIAEEALKFQPEEIIDLCRKYYKIQLTEEQSKKIASQAEGWIVAILLSLRSENYTLDIPKIIGAKEHVYTYLADDVIRSLPPALLEFMYATSLVDEFNIPLANTILGISNAEDIIKMLDDMNLFLTRTGSAKEATFRYHQLFSDFLREHLEANSQMDVQQLHLNIANWYQDEGQHVKAISHYFQAGDDLAAARMIDQIARQLYLTGQAHTLQSWYSRLSKDQELLAETPELLLNLAKNKILQADFEDISEILDIAEASFRQSEDHSNYVNLLVTRGMQMRFSASYEEAIRLSVKAQQYVENNQLDLYYWHQAERLKGISLYFTGKSSKALTHLEHAAAYFRKTIAKDYNTRLAHELVNTLADIGYIALTTGNIFEAQKSYREALNLAHKVRGIGTDFANACNNYAYLHYLLGNYQESWTYYLQAQEAAELNNSIRHLGYILNGQGDLLRDLEELDEARDMYQKALALGENANEVSISAEAFTGLVAVETQIGDYNQAIFYLREKAHIQNQHIDASPNLVSMANIYLNMGQIDLAQNHILQALETLPENPPPTQDTAELFFTAALIQHACNLPEESITHIQKCLEITALLGYDQFLVNAFRQNTKAVKKIMGKMTVSPQIKSILSRAGKKPPSLKELITPEPQPEDEQTNLNVTAFDNGTVRLNGEIIPSSEWGSVGARALFYFVLDRKQTTKDEIALEFWPEFSQAKVNSNFHATLWRVRNALSSRQILTFENDHYQINSNVQYYFDLDEFQALYAGLKNHSSPLEKRTAMRRMVEIYQNDYLDDIDMPWADIRRREFQNIFYTILLELAEEELDKRNYAAAHQHLLHATKIDYYQDDLHLKVMQTLEAMGDNRRAVQHYKEYARFLNKELNMEPDPKLKALRDRLST